MRVLALTLDLDTPIDYAGLHGLSLPATSALGMYAAPLQRFVELCQTVGGKGTVFAIGRDLGQPTAEKLSALLALGFEIGSHSFHHDYRLAYRSAAAIREDLTRGQEAFSRYLHMRPVGFRAPGYGVSSVLFDQIENMGFMYDASVLPSPPYYVVKTAVLTAYGALGQYSAACLTGPAAGAGPRVPYRPDRNPLSRGNRQLVELPLSVATWLRLPMTGASLTLTPWPLRALIVRSLAGQETVILGLHALDLADPDADGVPTTLLARQPELHLGIGTRQRILREVVRKLAVDRRVLTLQELALELVHSGQLRHDAVKA